MQTLTLTEPFAPAAVERLSWRALAHALRGDALAAFPEAAFDEEVVVQRFFGRQHILLQSPDAIRHVLVDNPQNYARAAAVQRVLRPMFGRGLFLSAGDDWRRQRRAVAPAFAPRMVQALVPRVVAATEWLADDLAAAASPVDLLPRLQLLALDLIGGAIFSLDMARHAPELRALIVRYASRLGRPSLADFLLPMWVATPCDIARTRFRRKWRRVISHIIAERALRPKDPTPCDLFDVLAAPDVETGAVSDAQTLGDQVATIVVAGHETTAAGLFWCLYLLARHPEAAACVAGEAEALALCPENAPEILPQLTHTRATVEEALRLYPPAFVIVRQALGDDLAGGIAVPKGSLVLIAPWILHRHRRFWASPSRFDPGRFLPGAAPPPRYVYMPFGAGPRTCVGAPFALSELVLVVAGLMRRLQIGLAPHRPVHPVGQVTLQPDRAPPFVLRPRIDR